MNQLRYAHILSHLIDTPLWAHPVKAAMIYNTLCGRFGALPIDIDCKKIGVGTGPPGVGVGTPEGHGSRVGVGLAGSGVRMFCANAEVAANSAMTTNSLVTSNPSSGAS